MSIMKYKQTGMATLMISVILLTSIGLMSIYSAQVSVMEQKISANYYRSTQAFESGQAGLDNVIQNLNAQIVDAIAAGGDENTVFAEADKSLVQLSNSTGTTGGQSIGSYQLTVTNNVMVNEVVDSNLVEITLAGFSGDNNAADAIPNEVIKQRLFRTPILNGAPPAPLIAKGDITLNGSVSIENKEEDSLAASWSGGATSIGTANIDVTSNDGSTVGGYSENQAALAGLGDDMFGNFFSESQQSLKNRSKVVSCNGGSGCSQSNLSTVINTDGTPKGSNIVWVDAKNVNAEGVTTGYDKLVIGGSNFQMGTTDNPVILIVDGDFEISGGADFHGVIYTTQDFSNGNNDANITGSLISEGNITATDGLNLTYDNSTFAKMDLSVARYVRVAGSWKDF